MYNFELTISDATTAQFETLSLVENISEEFQLQDHFGTISMAIHNVLEYIINSSPEDFGITINFLIEPEKIAVIIRANNSLVKLKQDIQLSQENNLHDLFSSTLLVDALEFKEDDTELYMEFHVKPYIKSLRVITKQTQFEKTNSIKKN
jgi:hypothetical protein